MSSKRRLRRKECAGKIQYETEEQAKAVAYKTSEGTCERINAYKCSYCNKFHVGHTPIRIKKVMGEIDVRNPRRQ